MEQLDEEVIDELSEPAKRVFRSLDYRSQRRMLKKAKEMGKQKRRKTQQKERIKKKAYSITASEGSNGDLTIFQVTRGSPSSAPAIGTMDLALWVLRVGDQVSGSDAFCR